MKKLTVLVLALFVLGFVAPVAQADTGSWLSATINKCGRGIENGVFGMAGELYHHMKGQADPFKALTQGVFDGLNKGTVRTLIGGYELATPFYHDDAILSDLDTVLKG